MLPDNEAEGEERRGKSERERERERERAVQCLPIKSELAFQGGRNATLRARTCPRPGNT